MEKTVFSNSLKKELRTYVNIKSGKPLKAISKRTSKAALRPVSCWDQVKDLHCAESKFDFEVRVKVRLRLQLHCHIYDQSPEMQRDGCRKCTGGSMVTIPIE